MSQPSLQDSFDRVIELAQKSVEPQGTDPVKRLGREADIGHIANVEDFFNFKKNEIEELIDAMQRIVDIGGAPLGDKASASIMHGIASDAMKGAGK